MVAWKIVGDGLYQRFDDGVGQNFYIGRCGEKGKAIAWQGLEMVDGDFEQAEWWHTLREAKRDMSKWNAL